MILENVADERGEPAAKVARTLVRLGCDLYLRFGPSREPYIGKNFFPEHPTVEIKYKIDPGDYTLTKESQEAVIKRLGRGDASTLGLFVRIDTKVDSSKTVSYQIELTEKDDSICVVVDPEDIAKLPPPSKYQTAPVTMYPAPPEKIIFKKNGNKNSSKRKSKKEQHTLVFLEALKNCDEKLKKESTPNDIWTHLKEHLRSKYDPNEEIISTMHHYEMIIIKSSGNDESLDKESFARAIRRLRKETNS